MGNAIYGTRWGMINVAPQGAGECARTFASGASPVLFTGLMIAETIVHYHIDSFEENLLMKMGADIPECGIRVAFIGGQTLRQLTYLTMATSVVFWS